MDEDKALSAEERAAAVALVEDFDAIASRTEFMLERQAVELCKRLLAHIDALEADLARVRAELARAQRPF